MNPAQTGGLMVSAVTLEPYVQWALNGFAKPAPDGLALLLAGAALTAAHGIYAFVKWKWFNPKEQAHA